jgi:Domain of unknown function (DUF4112)
MTDAKPEGNNLATEIHLSHAPRLKRLRQLSQLLDSAIVIPGTKRRIGIDPILGLIPGGGDTVSAALSGYIIIEAARMGLPRDALMRMVGNLFLDTAVGSVPLLGDIFDVVSKANLRNMQIVEGHLKTAPPTTVKTDKLFIALLIIGLCSFALAVGTTTVMIWSFISTSFR